MERASRDIILVHLVPLLGEKDIRSLAATCKALANVFSCIRHQTVDVRKNRGYFRRHLSRSTVRNISHLILNGTDTDNYDLFQCCDLRNMKRVTIVTRIADRHRFEFSQWELTDITEERDHNDKTGPPDGSSSLSNLPACTLARMERLRLDISIPRGFQTLLNVASNLRHLEFIPTFKPMEEEDLIEYIEDFETLVLMLRDRESLPNLKLVHVIAAMSISKEERRICENMIALSFTAAYQHGGWKLVSGHPYRGFRRDMTAGAWEYYWNEMSWDFFMTSKAFQCFVYDCSRWGLYPRITDFVEGRVHIQPGQGETKVGLMETEVYGVWVQHDPSTDLGAALGVATSHTKVISVDFAAHWGSTISVHPDSGPYHKVEGLLVRAPHQHYLYQTDFDGESHSAGLVRCVRVWQWSSLVNLSLPALAFQKQSETGAQCYAACGHHVGEYEMSWLERIKTLKALTVTCWVTCENCRLEPEVSFDYGMTFIPASVEYVQVAGRIICVAKPPGWFEGYIFELTELLKAKRQDLVVNLRDLGVREIGRTDSFSVDICDGTDEYSSECLKKEWRNKRISK